MKISKTDLANQMKALEEQAVLIAKMEEEKAELALQPHMILHVTLNNNSMVNVSKNLGFTLDDERFGTVTLAKLVKIENHGLPVVLSTPTGLNVTSDMYETIQAGLNLTCFAQVPLGQFGMKISGSKLLKIRVDSPLNLTTIQALGKNASNENCSIFNSPEGDVYLTQEQVASGVNPALSPKYTLLATVLFGENDVEERYNPQANQFSLALGSPEDLLLQLMVDSEFNSAKDASGLVQWSANRKAEAVESIQTTEELEAAVKMREVAASLVKEADASLATT